MFDNQVDWNYSGDDDLDDYVIIDERVENSDIKCFEIQYCGGILICEIDCNGDVVLRDFIGETRILFLPASITLNGCRYSVNPSIPDLAFESCFNIEYIIADYNLELCFGECVFFNCSRLSSIIVLSFGNGYSMMRHVDEPNIAIKKNSFCAIDMPNILIFQTGTVGDYYCDSWLDYCDYFDCYASSLSEEKREKEYGKFWKEKKTVLRDFRWLAELSGRIEQLMVSYSRDDNVVAFRRFLRWTNGDIPFSMFFTWHGLTQRVYFRCNYITSDVEDKELYDALCHMKPLKSEQYDGNWRRCL